MDFVCQVNYNKLTYLLLTVFLPSHGFLSLENLRTEGPLSGFFFLPLLYELTTHFSPFLFNETLQFHKKPSDPKKSLTHTKVFILGMSSLKEGYLWEHEQVITVVFVSE